MTVVYEDETLVVVESLNSVWSSIRRRAMKTGNARVNALLGRYAGLLGDPVRPGIVHGWTKTPRD